MAATSSHRSPLEWCSIRTPGAIDVLRFLNLARRAAWFADPVELGAYSKIVRRKPWASAAYEWTPNTIA
jgi:hypothetical protein